jgi:arylformamidase
MKEKVIDLSHPIEAGMVTHPGLPGPLICDFLSREDSASRYENGVSFHIGRIDMVANTGTYIDSPFHRFADGPDISGLRLAALVDLPCCVIRIDKEAPRAVTAAAFSGADVTGKAVLIHTGWDGRWGREDYLSDNPHLTEDAALELVNRGSALVGIDSVNIDSLDDKRRPVHSILLSHGIPIVEHLCNLGSIDGDVRFFAAPVAVRGMGTFPVRAYAIRK